MTEFSARRPEAASEIAGGDLSPADGPPEDAVTRNAFDKIKAGLEDAIAIARGEADPSTYRVHLPPERFHRVNHQVACRDRCQVWCRLT